MEKAHPPAALTAARPTFVIPVHNRRTITLACLDHLRCDGVLSWADIIVVDDGSSDGTSAAVRADFPAVRLLTGDGNLWWTGATARGMQAAFAAGAEAIFWLNDDCMPHPGACIHLLNTMRATGAAVSGVCLLPPDGPVVYGGLRRAGIGLALLTAYPDSAPTACDAACGNFVCLPRALVAAVGWPDARGLPHAHGDTDYLLRASARGFRVLVDPRARAWARPNAWHNYASWMYGDLSIADMWRGLGQKRSYAYFPAQTRFLTRHFGWRGLLYSGWTVLKRLIVTGIRLVVPRERRRAWWGERSAAWREERRLQTNPPGASGPTSGDEPAAHPGQPK